ncbi:succinate dehydrogenase / fumarate reductase, membrane anchor subunit [Azospirillaceae bacterium]
MTTQSKSPVLRTMLGQVRGLGSAKDGTHHWLCQRLTALALIPLTLWFIFSVVKLAGADYSVMKAWMKSPMNASLALMLVIITFHHAVSGLEVIIEDYVHAKCTKMTSLFVIKFVSLGLALACGLSILKLFVGG